MSFKETILKKLHDYKQPISGAARRAVEDCETLIRWTPEDDEWISVHHYLPERFVSVLVYMPGEQPFPTVHEGFLSDDGVWQSNLYRRDPGEVTHWKPMPEAPKENHYD